VKDVTATDLVRAMVGRDLEPARAATRPPRGAMVLKAQGVRRAGKAADPHATVLKDLNLEVYAAEVLGLAGLVGAGRSELARIIFGADRCDGGVLWLDGRERKLLDSPARAIDCGLALVPEDRKREGCFLDHSVRWNLSLPSLKRLSRGGVVVDEAAERDLVETYRRSLGIRFANDQVAIGTLSGGNQQKVLLARCLALSPKVLIVDEPTRGIDVAAKAEVHRLLHELAGRGVAVVMISSELPEVLAVSDRIVTFRDGQITGELDTREATEEGPMQLMAFGAAA
jgi:inositol transport system ATP-binding protein